MPRVADTAASAAIKGWILGNLDCVTFANLSAHASGLKVFLEKRHSSKSMAESELLVLDSDT